MMLRWPITLFSIAVLCACSLVTIADRYGNQYGGWYNHGANFAWQRDLCEGEMDRNNIPPRDRKLAMRCCMRDHGVPVEPVPLCAS